MITIIDGWDKIVELADKWFINNVVLLMTVLAAVVILIFAEIRWRIFKRLFEVMALARVITKCPKWWNTEPEPEIKKPKRKIGNKLLSLFAFLAVTAVCAVIGHSLSSGNPWGAAVGLLLGLVISIALWGG